MYRKRLKERNMKLDIYYIICVFFATVGAWSLSSCDDGHVDDPVYSNTNDSYNVQIIGTFKSLNTWNGTYSVAAACFDDESNYSLIQKVLPSSTNDTVQVLKLSNVPTNAKTVEIVVANTLRKRIATLYSYEIPENQRFSDTIMINVGTLNVGMFGSINQFIFQGSGTNCSRCHSSERATANLDLTAEHAYSNLVGVASEKDKTKTRVIPGDAENSFLYKVISEGDENVGYSHVGLFADDAYAPFLDIIKSWIDGGAKE